MVDQSTYLDQSHAYLTQAHEEFAQGDLRASEKAWGAASQIGDRRLVSEVKGLFSHAQALHTHFYEGNLNPEEVADYLEATTRFVDRVEALLSPQ